MSAPAAVRMDPSEYNWDTCDFELMLLTKHYSELAGRDIEAITVHHMTIVGDGDGDALVRCYNVWQNREASAHYGVDGKFVGQFVWDKDFAWATANNWGNLHTISIEHANRTAGPAWEVDVETWMTGAKLAAYLHVLYKLGRPTSTGFGAGGTLRTHQSFYQTACPGPYFKSIWTKYVTEVQRVYDLIVKGGVVTPPTTTPKTYTVVGGDTLWRISEKFAVSVADLAKWNNLVQPYIIYPGQVLRLTESTAQPPIEPPPPSAPLAVWNKPETWILGAVGPDVLRLGQRINLWNAVLGLPTWEPDDIFSSTERNALSILQQRWGFGSAGADLIKGGASDGYPGEQTFAKLMETPVKPTPTPVRNRSSVLVQNCASKRSDVGAGSWAKRRQILANVILNSDASFVVCPELYSEQRPWMVEALASKYALAGYREGRVLFYRRGRWQTAPGFFWKDLLWGDSKPALVDSFKSLVNGSWLTVSAWHTTWNTDAEGSRRRRIETATGIKWIKSLKLPGRKIYAGDFNAPADATTRIDDVEPVFEAYGYHDLEDDHEVRNGPGYYHLDRVFAGEGVKGESITVTRHQGSDHPATLVEFSY